MAKEENELLLIKKLAETLVEITTPVALHYYSEGFNVEEKSDGTPVTVADRECERLMRKKINEVFPDHGIIGEEFGSENEDAEFTWILDPIDGTKSFIGGGFDWGTIIGVLKRGEPILGVISQPVLNQMVIGDNTECLFNGKRVKVREGIPLDEATFLTTDLGLFARFQSEEGYINLSKKVKYVRTWGNCFGYMLVARGLADVMVDPIMSPWDLLPIIPVIRGAGGIVTDYNGGDPIRGSSLIAASKTLHKNVLEILNPNLKLQQHP